MAGDAKGCEVIWGVTAVMNSGQKGKRKSEESEEKEAVLPMPAPWVVEKFISSFMLFTVAIVEEGKEGKERKEKEIRAQFIYILVPVRGPSLIIPTLVFSKNSSTASVKPVLL